MSGYVSPVRAEIRVDYRFRIEGVAQERRLHIFTQADGSEQICNPSLCRECYREAHWSEGQTRG